MNEWMGFQMKELILCKLLHVKLGNPRALTWGGLSLPNPSFLSVLRVP